MKLGTTTLRSMIREAPKSIIQEGKSNGFGKSQATNLGRDSGNEFGKEF